MSLTTDTTTWQIMQGDVLAQLANLPDESVNCVVTSPPYFGLRDYGMPGQIGLEPTPTAFVEKMVEVFRQVRRVLAADGTLWLNLGDSYAASSTGNSGNGSSRLEGGKSTQDEAGKRPDKSHCGKPKDLLGIPWRVAFALQADGWYLRQDIIWHKPNPMPESVTDRCTKSHEYIFLLTKSARYFYDADAIKEPASEMDWESRLERESKKSVPDAEKNGIRARKTDKQRGHGRRHAGFNDRWDAMERVEQCTGFRNKRDVWTVATKPYSEAHFATFPPDLIRPCILAGCPEGGTVLDPFNGAGTTGVVATQHGRNYIGIELNPAYVEMSRARIAADAGFMAVEVTCKTT